MTLTTPRLCEPIETFAGITVVDVDTHLTEPADLWTNRAPKGHADRVPRVAAATDMNGSMNEQLARIGCTGSNDNTAVWVVDHDTVLGPAGAGSVFNRSNEKARGSMFIEWPMGETSLAASFVAPGVAMMDELGIWSQVLYPNVVGFGGQNVARVTDSQFRSPIRPACSLSRSTTSHRCSSIPATSAAERSRAPTP